MSAHPMDIRAHLEGAYEQVSERLSGIDRRFAELDAHNERRFSQFERHIDDRFANVGGNIANVERHINSVFLRMLGLIIISILLPVAQRLVLH